MMDGLSLRDYFAGQALFAFRQMPSPDHRGRPAEVVARMAYRLADAMLAKRETDGRLRDHEIVNLTRRAEKAERQAEILVNMREAVKLCLDAERKRQKRLKPGAPASTYTADRIAKLEALLS
jgi:acyl-CoA reductase-like NAD-dependent aldehyde dehydrogenase